MNAGNALNALIATLEQLDELLPSDKASWDSDVVIRLAVERLWISAGNLAEAYRIEQDLPTGIEPWSELAGYRHLLAHALPGDLSPDRVYSDTTADLDRILNDLRGRRQQ
ncbi:MAG: hypothetical protein M0Z87_05055 [Actinomycetota bacterium]|nr:hypothetical protein [Actinomycetota bacterium]